MNKLSYKDTLDDYVLNLELAKLLAISSNAYRFWKDVKAAKYDESKVVFLKKDSIPFKYQRYIQMCTDLSGCVQVQAFCRYTSLSPSHFTKSNNSKIYTLFELMQISNVKFLNLKKFYDDLGLDFSYHIYIEKCKFFGPSPLEKKIKLGGGMCLGYY